MFATVTRSAPAQLRISYLLAAFVTAVLLPVLGLAFALAVQSAQSAKQTEEQRIASVADALQKSLDQMFVAQKRTAWAVASAQSLQNGDVSTFYQTAHRAAQSAGGHFVLVDSTGQQIVNTRLPSGSPLPKTANPAAVQAVIESGEATIGNLGVGAVAKELLYAVRVPVRIGADIPYVLAYVPDRDAPLRLFDQFYLPAGWFAAINDGNGFIVARSQRNEDFAGTQVDPRHWQILREQPDYVETIDKEGRAVAASSRQSQTSEWTVVVGVPLPILTAPVRQVQQRFALLALASLSISLLAAFVGGKMLKAPTQALAQAAKRIGQGHDVPIGPFVMQEANEIAAAMIAARAKITEREQDLAQSQARLVLVTREMSHRAMNLLSVIQAIAKHTARNTTDLEDFQRRFGGRLSGLAQSHRLLLATDWTEVDLGDLARHQIEGFETFPNQVRFDGAPFRVNAVAAQSIGMAFHELATNAMKYGALSRPSGRVLIAWNVEDSPDGIPTLTLRWVEAGIPARTASGTPGFGSALLNELIAGQCGGTSHTNWSEDSMTWVLQVPVHLLKQKP
jgi:two-component sensor histidine kinase